MISFIRAWLLLSLALLTINGCSEGTKSEIAGWGIEEIFQARQLLVENYVDPIEPQLLLSQAWIGATRAAEGFGLSTPAPPIDDASFRLQFAALEETTKGKLSKGQLAVAAISTMSDSLNDKHTYFLPPNIVKQSRLTLGLRWTKSQEGLRVLRVEQGGPGSKAGFQPGDLITSVNGEDPVGIETITWDTKKDMRFAVQRDEKTLLLILRPEKRKSLWYDARILGA